MGKLLELNPYVYLSIVFSFLFTLIKLLVRAFIFRDRLELRELLTHESKAQAK